MNKADKIRPPAPQPPAASQRKGAPTASESPTPVEIDTGYPSEEALDLMRNLKTPKLKKITDSLF